MGYEPEEEKREEGRCTPALFLRRMLRDTRERIQGLAKVCHELLQKAARRYMGKESVKANSLLDEKDYVSELCEFVLLRIRRYGTEGKSVADMLSSHKLLEKAFSLWIGERCRTRGARTVRKDSGLKDGEDLLRRWPSLSGTYSPDRYYQKRINEVLRKKGRCVSLPLETARGQEGKVYFSYVGDKLPILGNNEYLSMRDKLLGGLPVEDFIPKFYQGEEPAGSDGSGMKEGLSGEELDELCRRIFYHVAERLGSARILSVDIVMDLLRKGCVFFAPVRELSLDAGAEDEDEAVGDEVLNAEASEMVSDMSFRDTIWLSSAGKRTLDVFFQSMKRDEKIVLLAVKEKKTLSELGRTYKKSTAYFHSVKNNIYNRLNTMLEKNDWKAFFSGPGVFRLEGVDFSLERYCFDLMLGHLQSSCRNEIFGRG